MFRGEAKSLTSFKNVLAVVAPRGLSDVSVGTQRLAAACAVNGNEMPINQYIDNTIRKAPVCFSELAVMRCAN